MEVINDIQVFVGICFGIVFVLFLAILVYFGLFSNDKNKEEKKSEPKKVINFVYAIIIVVACFFIMGMCQGKSHDWEPRHTQNINSLQNNVNSFIFLS